MFIRQVKTKQDTIQIQVMQKIDRQNRLVKHIGTAMNEAEVISLIDQAQQFIDQQRIDSGMVSFFDNRYSQTEFEKFVSQIEALETLATPIFDFFSFYYDFLGFSQVDDSQFKDLVIARIIHPVSKIKTLDWLSWKLNRRYSLTSIYRTMLKTHDQGYQDKLEHLVVQFVKREVEPVIAVLFFDVTTLYYEAFDEDDLRKCGFSKDHKNNQPQVVIALTVTKDGIPLHMKTFEGNKFEGHTIIPCIQELVTKHNLSDVIVVADSGMISQTNMDALESVGIQYIVGARLGNLTRTLFDSIVQTVPRTDGSSQRFTLPKQNHRHLIVAYSAKRAIKDKSDRNKRIVRAKNILMSPSSITSRYKYIQKDPTKQWTIHQEAIAKDTLLEGLKGYLTNTKLTDDQVIAKYANLWQVEHTFRISKSDLKARPIFHTVREKIEAHVTIVFASLAIAKYVELLIHRSIGSVVEQLEKISEIILRDKATREKFSLHTTIKDDETRALLKSTHQNWVM